MELPHSRVFEAQGRKKPTHDFLSACSNSNVHPDPMPSSQGVYPKTHDFLQPLERVGTRTCAKEEGTKGSVDTAAAASSYVQNQNVLPGGIGTYTISHMPSLYHYHHHQRAPKPEVSPMFTVSQASCNERNAVEDTISNCSSYAANNGFTLWNESVEKKGHTRKRQSQSFMDMIKSAKESSQEDGMDDEDEEFVTNKGNNNTSTSQCERVDLRVKLDKKGHGNETKPNTPRSKHSATEQRRRSKINARFQTLRQLIPNSDQKRDKASFLLEVIEYIHFLQEKVDKHELPEGTVDDLDMDHQQCLNRARDTTSFPVLGLRNSFFSPELSQLCPVSSSDAAAMECENLREEEEVEELSIHKGTISISSVYSQGLLKTLSETLQASGVDLSRSRISVQIKLSKQPQEVEEEVHRKVRPRSPSGDENHNDEENSNIKQTRKQKKLKKDHIIRNI